VSQAGRQKPGFARDARARGAFTLIELLAVVLLFGLLAGIAIPNLSLRSGQATRGAAADLAASLEFARQRAVVTGARHRVTLDLDDGSYRTEWFVSEARSRGEEEPEEEPEPVRPGSGDTISLSPPTRADETFRPLPGNLGDRKRLSASVVLAAVETPAGRSESGRLEIVFDPDGTAEPAELLLAGEQGERMVLSLGALSDTVRIRHGVL